jgi:signal peptidase I
MNRALIAVLDLLLLYFIVGHSFVRRFYTRRARVAAELKDIEKHYRHLLLKDRDILPTDCAASLEAAIQALHQARQAGTSEGAAASCLERYRTGNHVRLPERSHPRLRENLEMLVVALGLAFGIRALFLQPFKIPTGSMQPTLFGIHFVPSSEPQRPNPVTRFFGYLNYTKRYVDVTVKADGYIDLGGVRPARPKIPFFPSSRVDVGDRTYRLPGTPDDVRKYLAQCHTSAALRAGDVLARGALMLGDHLFVDRTHLAFREPRRGDVMVFVTDGITPTGEPAPARSWAQQAGWLLLGSPACAPTSLAGRFYIKRLVGMPGDTLAIREGRLYVREAGAPDFRLVDGSDTPAFPRIYSHKGGYLGYTHMPPPAQVLTDNTGTFAIPPGEYFMLGDNSGYSQDSRYWKTVPRRNLVGRALWVWWPFGRRWGTVDRLDPLDFPTASRMLNPRLPPLVE